MHEHTKAYTFLAEFECVKYGPGFYLRFSFSFDSEVTGLVEKSNKSSTDLDSSDLSLSQGGGKSPSRKLLPLGNPNILNMMNFEKDLGLENNFESPHLREEFSDPDIQEHPEKMEGDEMIAYPGDDVLEDQKDLSDDIEEFDARKEEDWMI